MKIPAEVIFLSPVVKMLLLCNIGQMYSEIVAVQLRCMFCGVIGLTAKQADYFMTYDKFTKMIRKFRFSYYFSKLTY